MTVYRLQVCAARLDEILQMQVSGVFKEKSSLPDVSIEDARYR
jgi:hypothetical protein